MNDFQILLLETLDVDGVSLGKTVLCGRRTEKGHYVLFTYVYASPLTLQP